MNLLMSGDLAAGYISRSQQARVVSEAWAQRELYCTNCDSPALTGMPNNYRAADLKCPACTIPFQLKAKTGVIGRTIADGAYGAMLSAIRSDQTPNLLLLRYAPESWTVRDLLLIPSFAFPESSIVKRKPLAVTAKRAGWIGCNIALGLIPQDARIPIIEEGIARKSGSNYKFFVTSAFLSI